MSSYRKGLRSKRRVKAYYDAQGYAVADVEDMSKYGTTDKFGIADLIVIDQGTVRLVQVKSNQPETQRVMQRVANKLLVSTVCATWYDYDGLRIQRYVSDELQSPFVDVKIDSKEVPNP